jgi:translation initiation factor 1A
VLVGLRDFEDSKADIIHKYTAEEARQLQNNGEVPASIRVTATKTDMAMEEGDDEEDAGFDFEDVSGYIVVASCYNSR